MDTPSVEIDVVGHGCIALLSNEGVGMCISISGHLIVCFQLQSILIFFSLDLDFIIIIFFYFLS